MLSVLLLGLASCSTTNPPLNPFPRLVVTDRLPHDPSAFTQGLVVHDGLIIETTGLVGSSRINVLSLDGTLLRSAPLPPEVFGEGVAVDGDTLLVLTWMDGRILRYTWPDLRPLDDLVVEGEGWGACLHDRTLWTTNGSADLIARDPGSGKEVKRVRVTDQGEEVPQINELECLPDGTVWANVWKTDDIIRIDVHEGTVIQRADASMLVDEVSRGQGLDAEDVLNGIALMPDGGLLLTGKRWDTMFVVRVAD